MSNNSAHYWDQIAENYRRETRISTDDFHYGPLVPGDSTFKLLPHELRGIKALEIGCGGAENSIYLAARGARCTALDISGQQLERAKQNALEHACSISFLHVAMEKIGDGLQDSFDLIHSAYALPFSTDPQAVLRACGRRLNPGGVLLFSTSHPLASGEWLELDDEGEGLWLRDYFEPPDDVRVHGHYEEHAAHYPLSTWFHWVREAGLSVSQLLEPRPEQVPEEAPYCSEAWLEHYKQLAHIPFVAIFQCRKPYR